MLNNHHEIAAVRNYMFLIQNIQNYLQLSNVRVLKYHNSTAAEFVQKCNGRNRSKIKFVLWVEQKILKVNLFNPNKYMVWW